MGRTQTLTRVNLSKVEVLFGRLFVDSMEHLIDEVIAKRGGSRAVANLTFVADRRLEVRAHAFERHPIVLESLCRRLALLPPEQPQQLTLLIEVDQPMRTTER